MPSVVDSPHSREFNPLSALLDGLQEGFYSLDAGWRFGEMNRAAEEHLRLDRKTASGVRIHNKLPAFAGSEIEARFQHVFATGERSIFESPSAVRPGSIMEFTVFPYCGGLGVSFRDVTQTRLAEAALRESQARLETATAAAHLGIWDWNLQTGEMHYSERAKAIRGFAPGEPVTLAMISAAIHPDDLPRTRAMAARAIDPAIREHLPYEYRIIRPCDGKVRWMLAYGEVVYADVNGVKQPARYVGTLQDITAQHEAVEALRDSEARLSLAIDAGRMAVWAYDFASNTLQGSPELNRLYGFPPDAEPTMEEFRSRYYADDRQRVTNAYQKAAEQNERFFEVEYRCLHPDQSVHWLLLRAENEVNSAGEPTRIVGVVLDITGRKQAEEHRELLINELNHRVKNTLVTVQSITRQTLRAAASPEQAREDIEHRLIALARAHDVLTRDSWSGASLREIVSEAVAAHVDEGGGRLKLDGPDFRLGPQAALALAMGVAELGTNAVKYGALSNDVGIVHVSWCVEGAQASQVLRLEWRECGGPAVQPPARRGFGTRLIEVSLARELGGQVQIAFEPHGVTCTFLVPLACAGEQAA